LKPEKPEYLRGEAAKASFVQFGGNATQKSVPTFVMVWLKPKNGRKNNKPDR
jgi:hypothetical protein